MILALDATNWLHATYHATNGVGVLDTVKNRIAALSARVQPSTVLAYFDRRSFRHELYPGYKANRPSKPARLIEILQDAEEALFSHAELVWQNGFEADDCLATTARIGLERGERVILATGDKDVRQCLVDGQVTQLRGFKTDHGRTCDEKWCTAATLRDEYGLSPAQWPSFQALYGDTGDNLPGAKGFGQKTTLACLAKCANVGECLANPWALPLSDRLRQNLAAFKAEAETMLRLVTLRTDVAKVEAALGVEKDSEELPRPALDLCCNGANM